MNMNTEPVSSSESEGKTSGQTENSFESSSGTKTSNAGDRNGKAGEVADQINKETNAEASLENNGALDQEIIPPCDETAQFRGETVPPQGEIIKPQAEITPPAGEIKQPREEIIKPQGEIALPCGEIHIPQGEIIKPRAEINEPQGEINELRGEIVKPWGETDLPRGETDKPRGEIKANGKVENTAENEAIGPKRRHFHWKDKLTKGNESSGNINTGSEISGNANKSSEAATGKEVDLYSLLKREVYTDPKKRKDICDTDEIISLNEDVRFLFKDENTIKKYLIKGKIDKYYLRQQKRQARDTTEHLESNLRKVNKFIKISKRDYLRLYVGVQSAMKFKRNEINYTCRLVNVLLYTLVYDQFSYKDILVNLRISGGSLGRMIRAMKALDWIGFHNHWAEWSYYLTETGYQFLRSAVEKKTTDDVKKV